MFKQFLCTLFIFISLTAFAQVEDDSRVLTEFIVMMQPGQNAVELVKSFPEVQIKKCLSKQMNIWLLQRSSAIAAEDFLQMLQHNKLVKLAQFNHRVERRSLVPNDSYFFNQWNMMNTGQSGGTLGADIDATDAWAINHSNVTAAGDSIVIAIIDGYNGGGFDSLHEDLNFFVNYHEVPNNNMDDDGNGFVDDYTGWNAFDSMGNTKPYNNTDPHAMHVSGIAAAIGNNAKGIAGVCWGAKILRVVGGSNEESQVVEAYDYVREMRRQYNLTDGTRGAFVVSTNSSFGINGGPNGARHTDFPIWCAMYDSMGAVGILSAAATANTAWNIDVNDDIPTGCPSKFLITVTNTTNHDLLNTQAAWGDTTIDLGAPGSGIYSCEQNNSYGIMSGTSMSSPHVAGAVAAMYAAACNKLLTDNKTSPDSIALLMKQFLLSGTTHLSSLYNLTVTGGRLNLFNAIKNLDEYNCGACNFTTSLTTTQPACSNTCNGSIQLNLQGAGTFSYTWSTGTTGLPAITNLCPGNYSVTVTNLSTNCSEVQNAYLYKPDSIVVSSINTIPAQAGDSGNIIVTAHAGNYPLQYSLDGIHYQQASTLIISNNGTYNVFIKNAVGCVVEQNIIVSGSEDISNSLSWAVFPNPANQELNISFNLSRDASVSLIVTNILGQKIFGSAQTIAAGIHTISQDLSSLSPGAYFITLANDNFSATKKFVVTR